jgi:hypothetical protein
MAEKSKEITSIARDPHKLQETIRNLKVEATSILRKNMPNLVAADADRLVECLISVCLLETSVLFRDIVDSSKEG